MKITRRMLRRWGACYNDAKIASLVPVDGLTPTEIAALAIPASDRLWVLLREELVSHRDLRLLACDWASSACHAAGWTDERSASAIAVARRYAVGEASEAELVEAASDASRAWFTARSAGRAEAAAAEAARWAASPAVVPDWVARNASRAAALSAAKVAEAASGLDSELAADAAGLAAWEAVRSVHATGLALAIKG